MILEINNMNFAYPNGAGTLKNVNLKLKKGHMLTILGKNGSGKSTLLSCICATNKPLSGEILINGKDVQKMNNKERAKLIAYVAQSENYEYDYLARDYITMGRAAHLGIFNKPNAQDYEISDFYIKLLGIEHLKDKLVTQMSGGEKQMTTIARALTQEPKIIIFDEPTSALDFGNQYKFLKVVKSLFSKDYTIILTTHNPDFAILLGGDVALVKNDGLVENGSVDEIIQSKNLSKLYEVRLNVDFCKSVNRRCCLTFPL